MTPAADRVGPTRLDFVTEGDLCDAARDCEAEVFGRRYGNSRQQLDEAYGPYRDQTGFIALSTHDGEVIGAVRVILPGPAGFKTLDDVAGEPWRADPAEVACLAGIDLDRTVDVATLGVRRGSALFAGTAAVLLHGLTLLYRANGSRVVLAVLDTRVRSLQHAAGMLYEPLPATWPAPYMGSRASVPSFARIPGQLDMQRRLAPESYRLITLGVGLGEVDVPDVSAFRFARPGTVVDVRDPEPAPGTAPVTPGAPPG